MAEFKNGDLAFSKVEVREERTEEKAVETEASQEKKVVVEAVKPQAKKKGGRKSIVVPTIEQKLDFVKRDKAIREHEVADFSVRTTKDGALELATRHFMLNYDITEDYASKILVFIHANAQELNGQRIYFDGLQAIAEALELSYPTVQKTVKKLREKNIISKASIGQNSYELSAEANRFFKSISNNIQIVLTFEVAEEEQLEAINKDGSLNEDMIK
jgi:DNA-binding MarR family transcriptional regulator